MVIIGLDQSFTKTGLVVVDCGSVIHCEKITSNKEDDYFKRAYDISKLISAVVIKYKPHGVYLEGLAFGSRGDQTRNLGGLQFTIVNELRNITGIDPHIVPPTTLKKFATGKGNCKKELMIETLPANIHDMFYIDMKLRKSTGLDDMADAYFLAQYGCEFFETQ